MELFELELLDWLPELELEPELAALTAEGATGVDAPVALARQDDAAESTPVTVVEACWLSVPLPAKEHASGLRPESSYHWVMTKESIVSADVS